MAHRVNLANGTPEDIRQFVVAVSGLAVEHERNNVRDGAWSGHDLCVTFAASYRGFHERMASTIYNKTRETMRNWSNPN